MLKRAYSTVELKAVPSDDGKRRLSGIASSPAADRMDDVVDPKGAKFSLPLPLLWQHDSSQPIGWVTAARVTEKGIEVDAELAQVDEEGSLKVRLDEAWQSLKAGLVRGFSIGFRGLETESIKGTFGILFKTWEWLELSAVTIPANAEATIQTVKSFDTGLSATPVEPAPARPSVLGKVKYQPITPQESNMNFAEELKRIDDTISAKQARLNDLLEKSATAGETLGAAEAEEFDGLKAELEELTAQKSRVAFASQMNANKATPVHTPENPAGSSAARGGNIQLRTEEKLEKGILMARYAMCKLAAKGNPQMAFQLAEKNFARNESIVETLKFEAEGGNLGLLMQTKATVNAGTTTGTTWAAPLVQFDNFAGDFIEFLRNQSIIGKFGQNGVPALNRIPFNVRIAGQTSGGNASWVGEGAPKPLTAFDFNSVTLGWAKIATIAVLTNELIRFSDPSAERLVRDGLASAVTERADIDFIDPAKAAVNGVSPASITNGATTHVSSGSTEDDITADIQTLWAPFIAARNPPRSAVYIMDSTTALALSMMRNPLGQTTYPGITMNGGTFAGVPVIVSDYLPSDTAGGMVVLVNAQDIWLADDGGVTVDASQEASLQMLDNPTNNSATGTATTMVSMFQTNSTAFRAERYINWARRRASGVSVLTGVNWGR